MGLFDFLQRDRPTAAAAPEGAAQAEAARVRAKRRLIGAVVLLGLGVVAFPLLFETQPRPIPVDIAIQIPSRDGAPPLALPAPAKPAAGSAPAPKVAAAPAPVPAPVEAAPPPKAAATEPAPAKGAEPAPPKPAPQKAADPVPPKAAPAKTEAAKPAATETNGRFVVQVGAFAEAAAVREARSKVEKLGLTTYTQQVDTASGPRTRVRLGPFATREEADKAAAKVKAAGLPGAVLAL
jgi:DedD protein